MREHGNAAPGLPAEKRANPGGGRRNSRYLANGFVNASQ